MAREVENREFEFMRIPKMFWGKRWTDVQPGPDRDKMEKYFRTRFKNQEQPCPDYVGLCLIGAHATGKTLFMSLAAQAFRSNGYWVLWMDATRAQDYFASGAEYEEDVLWFDRMVSVDVAAIDGLGMELAGVRGNNYVIDLIRKRMDDGKPTLLTTSLSEADLDSVYGAGFVVHLANFMPLLVLQGGFGEDGARKLMSMFAV